MPLQLVRNDITKMKADAIVNAANTSLLGGGGVDGAIHRAAGPRLLEECRTLGGCPAGEAKITAGYDLPARFVIHTVGPVWEGGSHGEESLLRSCYKNSLRLAVENHCDSVAFPLISAGVYGYPKDQALRVAIDTISDFLMANDPDSDLMVWLVLFGGDTLHLGRKLFPNLQEFIDDHYVKEHEDEEFEKRRRLQLQARKAQQYMDAQAGPQPSHDILPSRPSSGAMPSGSAKPSRPQPPAPPEKSRRRPSFLPWKKEAKASTKPQEKPAEEPVSVSGSFPVPDEESCSSFSAIPSQTVFGNAVPSHAASHAPESGKLDELIQDLDESFTQMVLRKIDEAGITDAQCYKRANLDRKLFSKIRSDLHYSPSKKTAVALAIALRLDLAETSELLRKAGFALSRSNIFDVIIEYFISRRNYNIFEINEALFAYDQVTLG